MGIVKLNTGFNIEVDFNIAAFHKRLFAWCLDIFILIAYIMIIGKLLNGFLGDGWDALAFTPHGSAPRRRQHILVIL